MDANMSRHIAELIAIVVAATVIGSGALALAAFVAERMMCPARFPRLFTYGR
jgi:hypothetical protein